MKSFVQNRTDRRNFFSIAGKSTIGAMFLAVLPTKLVASSTKYRKLKKVNIHKQAVSRQAR